MLVEKFMVTPYKAELCMSKYYCIDYVMSYDLLLRHLIGRGRKSSVYRLSAVMHVESVAMKIQLGRLTMTRGGHGLTANASKVSVVIVQWPQVLL